MPQDTQQPIFGRRFARNLTRLVRVYWGSSDAPRGALLLAGAIALELATVLASVLVARTEGGMMDGIERKDGPAFLAAVGGFVGVSLGFVLASTYRVYVRQALEIRWRRVLTAHFLGRWIHPQAYVQLERHRGEVDNPDQRVAEDVRDFVASALGLSLSLLAAIVTLVSFGGMLWGLSQPWTIHMSATHVHVPGAILWVGLAFAAFSTWVTHVVGRRLVPLNFDRLRFEADFRYGLMRYRDSVEPVALARGEDVERDGAMQRFRAVIRNFWHVITAQRDLMLLTTGIGQANALVPLLVTAPAYFAGHITLGSIVQVRYAYGQVSGGLSWFVNAYQEIARWRANVERLATFAEMLDTTADEVSHGGLRVVTGADAALRLDDVRLIGRDGRVLFDEANVAIAEGEHVALAGPSGLGKTALVRAIAGLWPFGAGTIELPRVHMLFMPQRPYFPIGSLRAVVSFPAPEGTFDDDRIGELLRVLGLDQLCGRIGDTDQWEQILSPHEQQRLALVRVFLHEPQWIFLDKATSALDEETETRVYELLHHRLPHSTIISVAHHAAIARFHSRAWVLDRGDDGRVMLRAA